MPLAWPSVPSLSALLPSALGLTLCLCLQSTAAQGQTASEPGFPVDRVVARFSSPETGGVASPRFIFERELAFEARLEALSDASFRPLPATPYIERHLRGALERHMAEALLSSLQIEPEPGPADLAARVASARRSLAEQVGGVDVLDGVLRAEGLSGEELGALLRRRARASLYLDRMVATMLSPSDAELRVVHRTTRTPYFSQPYEQIEPLLRRWYVTQRLNTAVRAFYEGARSRIRLTLLSHPDAR
jgi:hypothetical protein